MRIARLFGILGLSLSLAGVCLAAPATTNSTLPQSFAGWELVKPAQTTSNPRDADAANAAVLKEYGFTDITTATYSRDDGRQLTVKAARFEDASGAFGAYTFYRTAEMHDEEIGDQGSSLAQRVLFCRGKILVDAIFTRLSAMSAAELRELAQGLPKTSGTESKLPDLLSYLPKQFYASASAKYAIGPLAFEKTSTAFPPQYVDFAKGAEVIFGNYNLSNHSANLMLIAYPTAQIAASELAGIDAAQQALQSQNELLAKRRTGRILVLVTGNINADEAKTLASAVNYDADVTWNQNTYHNPHDNVGRVVLGGIILSAVLIGALLVTSIAFGGLRVAMKRLLPGKVFDRPEQIEIIALHLSDPTSEKRNLP
jgi:hypothetical protein